MGNLGVTELLLIFLVILLVFGAKRIPEIASGLGKGIREFKDATSDIKKEMTTPAPPAPQQIAQANVPPPVYVPPTPVAQPVIVTGPQDATAPPDAPAPPPMTSDGPRP